MPIHPPAINSTTLGPKLSESNTTESSTVLYAVQEHVATIRLNRPSSLNAMTTELMKNLSDAVGRAATDKSVRALVITGNGRGFCAGADLSAQADAKRSDQAPNGQADDHFNGAMRAINQCPVPTVARVNGAAAGGGFGLALSCDCLLYTSPSPRDRTRSRMPSSA